MVFSQALKMLNNRLGEQRWVVGGSEFTTAYSDFIVFFRVVYVLVLLCAACLRILAALVVQGLLTLPVSFIKLVTGLYTVSGEDTVKMGSEGLSPISFAMHKEP